MIHISRSRTRLKDYVEHNLKRALICSKMSGTLHLEDGTSFTGTCFGATVNVTGEVGKLWVIGTLSL